LIVLGELRNGRGLWCPVPACAAGFNLRWNDDAVLADSRCRVVDGSGQRHRVTQDGVELVEDGIC
jgi:hypothetical protein